MSWERGGLPPLDACRRCRRRSSCLAAPPPPPPQRKEAPIAGPPLEKSVGVALFVAMETRACASSSGGCRSLPYRKKAFFYTCIYIFYFSLFLSRRVHLLLSRATPGQMLQRRRQLFFLFSLFTFEIRPIQKHYSIIIHPRASATRRR